MGAPLRESPPGEQAWITMAPPGLNIGVPGWWRAMDALIEL